MIEITDANLAIRFAKATFRGLGPMNIWPEPFSFWSEEAKAKHNAIREKSIAEIIAKVNRLIRHSKMTDQEVARRLKAVKGKAKNVSITGCFCSRCGAALSAPDSVAAGIGPECQTKE